MKKLFLLALMCLMALSMNAQRCAVLEFKAGVGISQADVDGISAIFITYFRPAGYTMVERTQIDKAIDEQGFQRSKMTESQMVRIGEILNVSKIVVGDVNVVMGQYNVDVRAINVESGTIAATEGETFAGTSYRTTMQSIAQKLAEKISIKENQVVQPQPQQQPQQTYVDLGLPSGTIWKRYNEKGFLTLREANKLYGEKLPTKEQFEELKNECDWEWTGDGFKFIGPNGNELLLPAAGTMSCQSDNVHAIGEIGQYCTSTVSAPNYYYYLSFSMRNYSINNSYGVGWCVPTRGMSVRLVR